MDAAQLHKQSHVTHIAPQGSQDQSGAKKETLPTQAFDLCHLDYTTLLVAAKST
jgi:hypothetical protein